MHYIPPLPNIRRHSVTLFGHAGNPDGVTAMQAGGVNPCQKTVCNDIANAFAGTQMPTMHSANAKN